MKPPFGDYLHVVQPPHKQIYVCREDTGHKAMVMWTFRLRFDGIETLECRDSTLKMKAAVVTIAGKASQ